MKQLYLLTVILLSGCVGKLALEPDIAGEIVAMEVAGQVRSTVNPALRTVTIEIEEGADFSALEIVRLDLTQTASADLAVGQKVDLRSALTVVVKTVASYEWTVKAIPAYGSGRKLPGGSFDEWHRSTATNPETVDPAGRKWNPWPAGGVWEVDRWWDTGNRGTAMFREGNTTATDPGEGCPANPSGRAARLESVWALVKAAGGNIYFGQFGQLVGMDATCLMGHPWQTKPAALRGWYKYFPRPIDRVGGDQYLVHHPYKLTRDEWMGSPDSLSVIVALWASPDGADKPFEVNTAPSAFVDFLPDTPGILAWGQMISADEQASWAEFEVPLEYRTADALPANTQLLVQITASKNCNYFIAGTTGGGTGGKTGSLMYVDELELKY